MSLFADRVYGDDQPSNSAQIPRSLGAAFSYPANNSSSPQSSLRLPSINQQSCYWALLSADLQFIYLDPILQLHLEDQASHLVGKSLVKFVRSDEQETAQRDLGSVLESKTLNGSITRVHFSTISRIRRVLDHNIPPPSFTSAADTASEFMVADIVINWAAEGLVLCFIHASISASDDEHVKSISSPWCGTPVMTQEQLQSLSRSLLMCSPAPGSSHGRVFQILANTSARPSLLSWPPPQDGSSDEDITDLAKSVDLGGISTSQGKTNCTRRFKALRDLRGTEVESVYIPHGSLIFACHQLQTSPSSSPSSAVHSQTAPSTNTSTSIPHNSTVAFMGYNGSATSYSIPPPAPHQQIYDSQYSLPPLSSATTLPPPNSSYNYSSAQPTVPVSSQYSSYAHWAPPSHQSVQSLRSGFWNHHSSSYENGSSGSPGLPLSGGHHSHGSYARPFSPYGSHTHYSSNNDGHLDGLNEDTPSPTSATSSVTDVVPPPRRRVSPSSRDYREGSGASGGRERHGNRPSGLLKCSSCKTTTSPEWRKGPSGKKELCNACGLRYARSRAKKEGRVASSNGRKRKDKAIKREPSTPPSASSTTSAPSSYSPSGLVPYHSSASPYPSTATLRRVYYDDAGPFSSGNDIYGTSRSVGTSSPSPPAGAAAPAGGYTHYVSDSIVHAPHNTSHHRSSYYGSSIPSPLAVNPPMLQSQSFERDHRDREGLPPTPVSAEPRGASFFEASYERKDAPRGYEREYEREGRARSLVTG
ncbi:hypothetical protein BDP27DRAFT_1447845 [Rhodocollybia butyracea]|uniref:GATA-type domain-containing protein n=1 Tax=Rhodocollybia butyracea TaxID=206335 RepID=A0A9P5U8T0_9AGAR|nr:hypothetical protein BDP27DRAFT_1447845 [Rhodocollybia butyracea]